MNDNLNKDKICPGLLNNCYIIGPTGPRGPKGNSVFISGSYDTYEELIKNHPTGEDGESYLVDGELYSWDKETNTWEDMGRLQGPTGPKGDKGEMGPPGINLLRSAYIVTYNDGTVPDGIVVAPSSSLPIERIELDLTNLVTLNDTEKTIKFNTAGYYRITFIVSAYIEPSQPYNKKTDFITLGFRKKDTDNVYIGASKWQKDEVATQIIGHGIISVENPNNKYELVSLGKKDIKLNSPDLKDISSTSYFTNSLITIVVEYLGRQNG